MEENLGKQDFEQQTKFELEKPDYRSLLRQFLVRTGTYLYKYFYPAADIDRRNYRIVHLIHRLQKESQAKEKMTQLETLVAQHTAGMSSKELVKEVIDDIIYGYHLDDFVSYLVHVDEPRDESELKAILRGAQLMLPDESNVLRIAPLYFHLKELCTR